jgi:HAD superfamily hydrolase (TIGR01450 family)
VHVLCDLDGVVWRADTPIVAAPGAVARLRAAGHRVVFVSNNSFVPVSGVEAKLARFGIPADGDVFTSAQAAARLVAPGERVLLIGGPGIAGELAAVGAEVVEPGDDAPVDAVVVGLDPSFTYDALARATRALRHGARLIGTNGDTTYPTADGVIPGAGSLLAAVAAAGGVPAVVAGKPHAAMVEVVRDALGIGPWDVMVGDRADTDGAFARALGCRFALVLSGVTASAAGVDPMPDLVAAHLGEVSDAITGA